MACMAIQAWPVQALPCCSGVTCPDQAWPVQTWPGARMACRATQAWPVLRTSGLLARKVLGPQGAWVEGPWALGGIHTTVPRPKTVNSLQRNRHRTKTLPLDCTDEHQNLEAISRNRPVPVVILPRGEGGGRSWSSPKCFKIDAKITKNAP